MDAIRYILDFQWTRGMTDGPIPRLMFMAFFVAVLIFALCQKREWVYQGAPDQARWRDLRLWAAAVMLLQVTIYIIF